MPLIPNADTRPCADCFCSLNAPWSAGAAVTQDGVRLCYACADKRQREDMAKSDRFMGYLSSDGARFTTWSGGELGTVIAAWPCRLTRISFTHSRDTYKSVRVRATDGSLWYGRGSPGIVITLRRVKGSVIK